jgi:hypothetical protein
MTLLGSMLTRYVRVHEANVEYTHDSKRERRPRAQDAEKNHCPIRKQFSTITSTDPLTSCNTLTSPDGNFVGKVTGKIAHQFITCY